MLGINLIGYELILFLFYDFLTVSLYIMLNIVQPPDILLTYDTVDVECNHFISYINYSYHSSIKKCR